MNESTPKNQKRDRKPGDLFTGRRKTSVARVMIKPGTGRVTINSKPIEEYVNRADLRNKILQPLILTEKQSGYDVFARVRGGGISGQAEAIMLGLARCVDTLDPKAHAGLRKAGLLTRDPRMVERKKYGLHKARRATQFSKR